MLVSSLGLRFDLRRAQAEIGICADRLSSGCGSGEQLLRRNVKRFRGGLVFEANRLVCHSTLGRRAIKKKKKKVQK
jgi:hypothetical protein